MTLRTLTEELQHEYWNALERNDKKLADLLDRTLEEIEESDDELARYKSNCTCG